MWESVTKFRERINLLSKCVQVQIPHMQKNFAKGAAPVALSKGVPFFHVPNQNSKNTSKFKNTLLFAKNCV